ncbi:RagB/SusD family nutrient uptake outer membrane protein [Myroides sp. BIT-d1]|uniref:RagB/SusD family nutrient uptake outer membrane protein n=2 Tax=Myroides albus TaxID=2562892 RepID=A0A6I3LK54_9FLAO|nr:RagB/SusD family nutrient uptake outer membrane protein [Myroides albus]
MKNTYKLFVQSILSLLSLLTFTSCDKMLDIDSKDNVDSEHIFKSVKNFEYAVLGTYADLHLEYNALIGSILADECRLSPENNGVDGYGVNLHRWTYSSDDEILSEIWSNYYNHIYRINNLLINAHKVPVERASDQAALNSMLAELHGLRALIHFELHRIFGAGDYQSKQALTIPYITTTDVFYKPGKITLQTFYDNLWSDIDQTDQLTHSTNNRLSQGAIAALSARIALYERDYLKAIHYSSWIIEHQALATVKNYANIWTDSNEDEVLFKLKRNAQDKVRPNTLWYNYATGKTLFYSSEKIRESYDQNDVRNTCFLGQENNKYIVKYGGNQSNNRINDYKVFRTSEAYLIRAEAYLAIGQSDKALSDVNTILTNRYLSKKQIESINQQVIEQQRLLEFAYEGHRYFDLKRLGKDIQRNQNDLVSPMDSNLLSNSDEHYLLPIPQKEIQANPNLK